MPEGVDYGPQYTASTGKSLNIVGKYAYGYSGIVEVTDASIAGLDFITPKGMIDCIAQFHYSEGSSDDIQYTVKFNGEVVLQYFVSESHGGSSFYPGAPLYLMLPPLTRVEFLMENISTSTARDNTVTLIGKIYK